MLQGEKGNITMHSGVFVFPRKTYFFLKMFFLSGKNGFNVCLSLQLISLLKKCICLIISLFFLRQKVCKISLQHTKDVKLLPGTYLANSFVNRGKKCTFQWHTNKIAKFMNRRKRFEIPIYKKKLSWVWREERYCCTSPLNCCYSPRDMPVHTPGSWQGHSKVGPTTPPGSWPLKKIHHNELYNVTC